jgi:hypothetical protein
VPEVKCPQPRQRAVPVRDLRDAQLTRVQPLELEVRSLRETPQASYSPSSDRIRRMIATDDA